MVHRIPLVAAALAAAVFGAVAVVTPPVHAIGASATADPPADATARGRYLIRTSGCNDCHTADFAMTDGKVPEKDWLTGDALGWQGPWGTTYAPNLRTYFRTIDEESWVSVAKTREFRPPMPGPSLRAMTDEDLRAVYRYVRALGPAGGPAPAYAPPGHQVAGPVVVFPAPPK
jgi:mono/diheme cytochrome c family protein